MLLAVVVLQLVGTMASLYLPSLNASIIDEGVARGDTGFIWRTGGVMVVVTLVQIACSIAATYLGARTAMSFGRDVRGAVFQRVLAFSARELNQFGAPSLITRTTNDVQQVQMLVLLVSTMFVAAPITMIGGIMMALREDVGLSWLVVVAMPVLGIAIGLVIRQDAAAVQVHAGPDRRREPGAARADHRHPGGPGLRPRAVRGPALRRAPTATLTGAPDRDRPAAGVPVPDRHVRDERLQRRGAVVRGRPDRRGPDAGRVR